MAFIREELTEQDKEFIAGFQFENPFGCGLARISDEWVTDRERGYYLIFLGGSAGVHSLVIQRNIHQTIIG